MREAAYGRLVEARRRELHLRVGEALVELHLDSPAEVYGLLAHHFAEAHDAPRAVEYLLRAGDAARAAYADSEAIELYRKALGFLQHTPADPQARATLLRIALTHHLAFDFRAANEALREAFALSRPDPVRSEPSERVSWATAAGWPVEATAPGITRSDFADWVAINLFRGLLMIGRDFEIELELAEWMTVSDDGLTYRFTLRPDARWSDGTPVTAEDFAFTFARMVEDEGETTSWLDGIAASALDEGTLEIRLAEPLNHFLHMLGQPALYAWPRHVYERRGREWYKDVPLVGNGPFVLTERRATGDARSPGRITLESAPTWYGARGNVREVRIVLEASPAAAGDRWKRGDYDLIYDVFVARAGDITGDETVVEWAPGGFTEYLGLDATRPPLDDVRIRRAVAHAIDRTALGPGRGGTAATTGGLLPPAMPGHSHRVAQPFDPERARALLVEAGHPEGRGIGEILLAHWGHWEDVASEIEAQLDEVGLRVRRLPAHSYADLTAAIEGPAHMYQWAWGYDFPDPGRGFIEPLLRWGTWLYRDERLEGLLRQAATLRDQDERLRVFREFERLWIGEQAAVVPLVYSDRALWRRPWLTGMWVNAIAKSSFAEAVVRRP